MPAAEVDVTVELVQALLVEQFPDLAASPLTLVANGWDNAAIPDDISALAELLNLSVEATLKFVREQDS